MGMLSDDNYDDLYPPEHYPEYDFNRDGHIDWFEAGEIETDEAYEPNWDRANPLLAESMAAMANMDEEPMDADIEDMEAFRRKKLG